MPLSDVTDVTFGRHSEKLEMLTTYLPTLTVDHETNIPSNSRGLTMRLTVWDANSWYCGFASKSHKESKNLKFAKHFWKVWQYIEKSVVITELIKTYLWGKPEHNGSLIPVKNARCINVQKHSQEKWECRVLSIQVLISLKYCEHQWDVWKILWLSVSQR